MKQLFFGIVILLSACNNNGRQKDTTTTATDTTYTAPTVSVPEMVVKPDSAKQAKTEEPAVKPATPKIYSNKRFKAVTVERTGEHTFLIQGKAQIFEANFNWVVEDGHDELKKGFEMTDAGAPAWGNFSFSIDVAKKRENSTLTLILFESSAKDGSRQYELPVVLY